MLPKLSKVFNVEDSDQELDPDDGLFEAKFKKIQSI